jgi:UDP-N-acetylmuramate dehydrogenase
MMDLLENISIKPYTTFGIEAKARYFAEITSIDQLKQVLNEPLIAGLPIMPIGGGSNMLFTSDYNGVILRMGVKGISVAPLDENFSLVTGNAGEVWDTFVDWCVTNGYAGLENLSLIPGTVGSCPIQNIGAYGVEVSNALEYITAFDKSTSEIVTLQNVDCKFGYRDSIFKRQTKGQYIILSVTFRLAHHPVFHTQYGAITAELEAMGIKTLSIEAIRKAVIAIRSRKIPDPFIIGNAGSFFKNPTVSANHYNRLKTEYPTIIAFPLSDGSFKLAAGWLIEQCGWKGYRKGDAGVHAYQALVLVNYGASTGTEIVELANDIMASVFNTFGVHLDMEVNII